MTSSALHSVVRAIRNVVNRTMNARKGTHLLSAASVISCIEAMNTPAAITHSGRLLASLRAVTTPVSTSAKLGSGSAVSTMLVAR